MVGQGQGAEGSGPDQQHHSEVQDGCSSSITVRQQPRQLLKVSASALLPLSPHQAFAVITHPHNEQIFRHLDRCTHHQVLAVEEGGSRRLVESEHLASWRLPLLGLSGSLRTRLRVDQDFQELRSAFTLVPGRFHLLRTFSGQWRVQALPAERCAHLRDNHLSISGDSSRGDRRTRPEVDAGGGGCCLLTLEQELQPTMPMPPPLSAMLKQLACRQLAGIFADLQQEARRINSGQPSLWPVEERVAAVAAAVAVAETAQSAAAVPPTLPEQQQQQG